MTAVTSHYNNKFEVSEMEGLKMHIRHVMLWEFKQGNNDTESAEKICSVYGEGAITDRAVRNWFMKFRSRDTPLNDEPRSGNSPNLAAELLKSLVECNARQSTRELADKLNTSQSAICRHLEKMGKVSKLAVWVPHALSEKNKADH